MQRLFTVFPGGAPGLALVLLRLGVAASLCQPLLYSGFAPSGLRLLALGLISVLLLIGLATPLLSAIAFVYLMTNFDSHCLHTVLRTDTMTGVIQAIFALSLALIGPGAFSVDARLFGRRVLTPS
jgi:hypothetical protein